jgi:hypothetical protein
MVNTRSRSQAKTPTPDKPVTPPSPKKTILNERKRSIPEETPFRITRKPKVVTGSSYDCSDEEWDKYLQHGTGGALLSLEHWEKELRRGKYIDVVSSRPIEGDLTMDI